MSRQEDVLDAYEAWDPDVESSSELAARLGISKARLYQILESEGVTPKARRPRKGSLADRKTAARMTEASGVHNHPELIQELTARGVQNLMDELEELRRELKEYRERFGPLD